MPDSPNLKNIAQSNPENKDERKDGDKGSSRIFKCVNIPCHLHGNEDFEAIWKGKGDEYRQRRRILSMRRKTLPSTITFVEVVYEAFRYFERRRSVP